MDHENLYIDVKNKICDAIFRGVFADGERIPAERVLAEKLGVSRVTLRKSLGLLEAEGLIVKEVGSGTRVTFHNRGNPSSMDMVVLMAPAQNPFFAGFIRQFQESGQSREAMVLYVEKPHGEKLEESIYRLLRKNLYNVVIWLEDLPVDRQKLEVLRALGMNMVFFDTTAGLPYGDCVSLDNEGAVGSLCDSLWQEGIREIAYVGWDNQEICSVRRREEAFIRKTGKRILCRPSWEARETVAAQVLAQLGNSQGQLPQAIVSGNRECGMAVANAVSKLGLEDKVKLAAIDDYPGADNHHAIICRQNISKSVEQIYRCLEEQNHNSESWKAKLHKTPGHIIKY